MPNAKTYNHVDNILLVWSVPDPIKVVKGLKQANQVDCWF